MRKKVFIFISFLVVVAALLVACYEELDMGRSKADFSMTYEEEVTAAREFYESLRDSKTRGASMDLKSESGMIANMEPLWGKEFAYRRKGKKNRTVEAVMDGSKRMLFILPEVREKYLQTKDPRYKQSITRLVVKTDSDTGEKQAFTMTILPDLAYLEKTNFKPFYNTYVQKDKDFSGVILFHELDGYFANGWRYTDGKVTHSISGTTFSHEEIEQYKAQTRATEEQCTWIHYYIEIEQCRVWCYMNEYKFECGEEQDCYTYWEYYTSKYECVEVDIPGSGGENDGGYIPPPDTPTGDRTDPAVDCAAVASMMVDEAFNHGLDTLWGAASGTNRDAYYRNVEDGWIIDELSNVITPSGRTRTSLRYDAEDLEGRVFDKRVHTHPDGSSSPSFDDIYALCRDFNQGRCSEDYFYGVISTYGIVGFTISNRDAFSEYASLLIDTQKGDATYATMESEYNSMVILGTKGSEERIKDLITYFEKYSSGINVISGARMDEDYNESKDFLWRANKKSRTGTLINKCK